MDRKNRLPLFYLVTALFWFALYAYVPFVAPFGEALGSGSPSAAKVGFQQYSFPGQQLSAENRSSRIGDKRRAMQ